MGEAGCRTSCRPRGCGGVLESLCDRTTRRRDLLRGMRAAELARYGGTEEAVRIVWRLTLWPVQFKVPGRPLSEGTIANSCCVHLNIRPRMETVLVKHSRELLRSGGSSRTVWNGAYCGPSNLWAICMYCMYIRRGWSPTWLSFIKGKYIWALTGLIQCHFIEPLYRSI